MSPINELRIISLYLIIELLLLIARITKIIIKN